MRLITKKIAGAVISSAMLMILPCASEAYAAESCGTVGKANTCGSYKNDSEVTELSGESTGYSVYEKYGLLHDEKNSCYTYKGDVVRFFNDPIAGASFTNFFTGTVDIEAEYDEKNNLIGIKKCSEEAYERHTEKFKRFSRLQ